MTESEKLIMSIKPRFARAILNGSKRVELRRKFHRKHAGKTVLVYSSSPDKKVIGEFLVESVDLKPISDLWRSHGVDCLVGWEDFKRYFSGLDVGYAISVSSPRKYDSPLDPWFRPPQSYMIDRGKITVSEMDEVKEYLVNENITDFYCKSLEEVEEYEESTGKMTRFLKIDADGFIYSTTEKPKG